MSEFKPSYKTTKIVKVLNTFLDSNKEIASITFDTDEYKSVNSACNSYRVAIKRATLPVLVTTRHGVVYLVRTDKHFSSVCTYL